MDTSKCFIDVILHIERGIEPIKLLLLKRIPGIDVRLEIHAGMVELNRLFLIWSVLSPAKLHNGCIGPDSWLSLIVNDCNGSTEMHSGMVPTN